MAVAPKVKEVAFRPEKVHYPTSDGKPMGETDRHIDLILYLKTALPIYFGDGARVYVSGNNFLYYEEGDPKACVSPDGYVVFGVENRLRDSYFTWEEGGRTPAVVFEFTSTKTVRADLGRKFRLYERVLRVPEYFLFDPREASLNPRLQGFRLVGDRYVPLALIENRLHSEQLGLDLVQEGDRMRLWNPVKGEWLLSALELGKAKSEAEIKVQTMAERLAKADEEMARLRVELEALRRGGE